MPDTKTDYAADLMGTKQMLRVRYGLCLNVEDTKEAIGLYTMFKNNTVYKSELMYEALYRMRDQVTFVTAAKGNAAGASRLVIYQAVIALILDEVTN